jgi:hypothetical protein
MFTWACAGSAVVAGLLTLLDLTFVAPVGWEIGMTRAFIISLAFALLADAMKVRSP